MDNIITNGALNEVGKFVNWVKTRNPQLAEKFLEDNTFYKISDVEKLFEVLDDTQKKDYQFFVDNEHNFIAAAKLGLSDVSYSMPSGEPGHKLIQSLKIVKDASIEEMPNLLFVPFRLEIEEVGRETIIFEQPNTTDALNQLMSNTTDKNMDLGTLKGGTNMMDIINKIMNDQAVNNIDKVRQVIYFTDGEPNNPKKPSNK